MEPEEGDFYDSQEQYFVDCCREGDKEEIQELLKDQALDLLWTNQQNNNCLHMAAANGHIDIIRMIMETCKDDKKKKQSLLNGKNADGNTPLHYATICRQEKVVELLIAEGSDPNVTNECSRTPLKQAQLLQNYVIAEMLAKVTKTDPEDLKVELIAQAEQVQEEAAEEDKQ